MQRKGTLTKTARELRPVAYGEMDTPMTTLKRFKDKSLHCVHTRRRFIAVFAAQSFTIMTA